MTTLSADGVKQVIFQTASCTSDWHFPYRLVAPISAWTDLDEVVVAMSPDFVSWDDYGFRSRSMPPYGNTNQYAPFWQASSNDGSGVVSLVDPNTIDILIGYNTMRQLGPGGVNVEVQYRQTDSGARSTLLIGRLPLIGGQF